MSSDTLHIYFITHFILMTLHKLNGGGILFIYLFIFKWLFNPYHVNWCEIGMIDKMNVKNRIIHFHVE
jgi:hypothetical protein